MDRIKISNAWSEDQCELKHACTAADLISKLNLVFVQYSRALSKSGQTHTQTYSLFIVDNKQEFITTSIFEEYCHILPPQFPLFSSVLPS